VTTLCLLEVDSVYVYVISIYFNICCIFNKQNTRIIFGMSASDVKITIDK
jgi:hypothetical protein